MTVLRSRGVDGVADAAGREHDVLEERRTISNVARCIGDPIVGLTAIVKVGRAEPVACGVVVAAASLTVDGEEAGVVVVVLRARGVLRGSSW